MRVFPQPASDLASLERDRKVFAGWVILIDKSLLAMEKAVQAAVADASAPDLVSLSESSLELRVLAAQVRDLRAKR